MPIAGASFRQQALFGARGVRRKLLPSRRRRVYEISISLPSSWSRFLMGDACICWLEGAASPADRRTVRWSLNSARTIGAIGRFGSGCCSCCALPSPGRRRTRGRRLPWRMNWNSLGIGWKRAKPSFFVKTSIEVSKAILAVGDGTNNAVLRRHLARIDDPRLRRAFRAAVGLQERSEAPEGSAEGKGRKYPDLWKGLPTK